MVLAPPKHRAYSYRVTIPAPTLAVTLELFKDHIKRSGSTAEDRLLSVYLGGAIGYAEKFTRRDFLRKTYVTYRDFFPQPGQNEGYYPYGSVSSSGGGVSSYSQNVGYEIRKSPLVSVTSITYINSEGTPGTIVDDSTYYSTVEDDYSEVVSLPGSSWPVDSANVMQAITITFICGMVDTTKEFEAQHADYVEAILAHATNLWANRGDCSDSTCGNTVPASSKSFYLQNRIENI